MFEPLEKPSAEDVHKAWAHLRAAASLLHGTHSTAEINAMISDGRCQLWPAEQSAVLTETVEWPQTRDLSIAMAGGVMSELVDMVKDIEDYAYRENYDRVLIVGRDGWRRVFPDYQHGYTMLFKDLRK